MTPRQEFYAGLEMVITAGIPLALFALIFFTAIWRLLRHGKDQYELARHLPFENERCDGGRN